MAGGFQTSGTSYFLNWVCLLCEDSVSEVLRISPLFVCLLHPLPHSILWSESVNARWAQAGGKAGDGPLFPDSMLHLRGGAADLSLMTACSLGEEAGYFQEVPQPAPLSDAQLLLPAPEAGGWPWLHTSQAPAFSSLVSPVGPDGCGINEASHLVWGVSPGVTFSSPCIVSPRAWSDLLH